MQFRRLTFAFKVPREHSCMALVVAKRFAIWRLMFLPEMRTGRFVTLQCVNAHQFGEFEEICNAPGAFQCLVVILLVSRHAHVAPEFGAQFWDFSDCFAQSLFVTRHPAFVPEEKPELAMERIG